MTNLYNKILLIAGVVGIIGYTIESSISDKYTPWEESVVKRREKRQLEEQEAGGNAEFVPKNVFQKNQSPQLKPS